MRTVGDGRVSGEQSGASGELVQSFVVVAEKVEAGERGIRASHIATQMGWEYDDVAMAIEALSLKYIETRPLDAWQARYDWGVVGHTDNGGRAVGLWPDG